MKSVITKRNIFNLSLCLLTVFILASCSSNSTRTIAQEESETRENAPQKFHAKRFEQNNGY